MIGGNGNRGEGVGRMFCFGLPLMKRRTPRVYMSEDLRMVLRIWTNIYCRDETGRILCNLYYGLEEVDRVSVRIQI